MVVGRMTAVVAGVLACHAGTASASVRKPAASNGPSRVCYARVYDAAHLAAHPKQSVTSIAVTVEYRAGDNDHPFPSILSVRRRGSPEAQRGTGDCSFRDDDGLELNGANAQDLVSQTAMRCSAGPDAGGFVLKRAANGAKALLDLRPFGHVVLEGRCGSPACAADLKPGADDKTFLLESVPDAACPAATAR